MRKIFLLIFQCIGLFILTHQMAFAEDISTSKKMVEKIVDQFQTAIKNKDVDGFMQLFVHEAITWTAVYTDSSVERYNVEQRAAQEPLAKRVQTGGTPRKFIEGIVKAKTQQSELFSNVRIDTDGDIAQVWFDYIFIVGEYKSAWGKESWQLARTENGWKIASVVWSAEENTSQH